MQKKLEKVCRGIAFILLISFTSCSTAPNVNFPQFQTFQQLQRLQSGGTAISSSPPTQQQPAATSKYWTGDGGKGSSITILPPRAVGLIENQNYLPDLVANELVQNFQNYSA